MGKHAAPADAPRRVVSAANSRRRQLREAEAAAALAREEAATPANATSVVSLFAHELAGQLSETLATLPATMPALTTALDASEEAPTVEMPSVAARRGAHAATNNDHAAHDQAVKVLAPVQERRQRTAPEPAQVAPEAKEAVAATIPEHAPWVPDAFAPLPAKARAPKRARRKLDPHELERLAAGRVTLPVVTPEESVPVAPHAVEQGATMVPASAGEASVNPRRVAQGVAASLVAVAGAGIGFTGMGSATATPSAALTASLVGGTDQEVSVPAALTGSATAQVRSAAQDITAEAASSPVCTTDGATGLRAAYANTKNVLVWPLAPGTYTLTSSFGSRIDPIYRTIRVHAGQDLAGPLGTPVYAAADGVVVETLGSNNMVRIRHEMNGEVFYTAYLHMYARDILVKEGDVVTAGQRIGAIGNYGKSTGPHLHFETHDANDQPVEPTSFMKAHGAIQITNMCN